MPFAIVAPAEPTGAGGALPRIANHAKLRPVLKTTVPLALILACSCADAAAIFTSFGPGQTYDAGAGYVLETNAFGFVPIETLILTHVDFAAAGAVSPETLTFTLTTDSGGVPGAALESWTFANVARAPIYPTRAPVLSADSILRPTLFQGHKYWMVGEGDGDGVWFFNDQGLVDMRLRGGAPWIQYPSYNVAAYDVIGTAVPEPRLAIVIALAIPLLWHARPRTIS